MSHLFLRRLALRALAAMALLAAAPAFAQTPAVAPPPEPPATVKVTLTTSEGPIVLELQKDKAPITTANFLRYVDQKRYDGATFYRASKTPNAPELGLIQGGVQNDPARVLKPIAHEPTTRTGLSHTDGAISMGRFDPGSATSDFFIVLGDMTYMDANPALPGDNLGFAVFGKVVDGMDTVRKILAAPTSATKGEGVMKGEILAQPVKIITARRAG
ncbi:peptidylprolyl isomerase [Phenylobacterium sp.]|uniref:peptidylprolyl isomerase n=1 Tax=Phenylobacterium sp. TaxID=1871053 RepID=UPI00286D1248|nr:peptidylprolyl isomerase [Phenylobacterium sp.]